MYNKICVLYDDKTCNECGDCNFCDINPDKVCDNCGECLSPYDYNGIQVERLIIEDNYLVENNPLERNRHQHICNDSCGCDEECSDHDHCNCDHDHNE